MAAKREWWLLALTCVLAVPLWCVKGSPVGRGDVIDAALTVTPEDSARLSCELPWSYEGYRCEYQSESERFSPPPTDAQRVQPFVSLERDTLLVPGLFSEPSVAKFVATIPVDRRFVARCKLRLVTRTEDARIRFHPSAGWEAPKEPIWLAAPVSCAPE